MADKKKKTKSAAAPAARKPIRREVRDSVLSVISFAVTLLLLLTVYVNLLGGFGRVLYACMHGLFGWVAFLLPAFTLWLGVNLAREKRSVPTATCLWTGLVLSAALSGVCYLFEPGEYFGSYSFGTFFSEGLFHDFAGKSGGIVGGLIGYPLILMLTKVGFAIIFITIALVCAITFFDVTLYQVWSGLKEFFTREEEYVDDEPEAVTPIVQKKKRRKNIDVFVDDDTEFTEVKEEDEVVIEPEPEGGAEKTAPVFVYDDIDRDKYISPADAVVGPVSGYIADAPIRPETEGEEYVPAEPDYVFPPTSLLEKPKQSTGIARAELAETEEKLIQTLADFGIEATALGAAVGPIVTRYELVPSKGVRVSKITSLTDDIALALAATSIRIEAPIPGKAAVGIEVPNKTKSTVYIRELLEAPEFTEDKKPLTVALGKDISGNFAYCDLADMPHLLIAGTTGSGKSVCVNTILVSLLYRSSPADVKMILIDPKVVEFEVYARIPHLIVPVVTNAKKAAGALQWAVNEMERRYSMFSGANVRNIGGYNAYVEKHADEDIERMPQIVVVIDELADLMMVAAKEVEDYIVRLCQKARAAGIHLIIATQRPSVNVVTGLIKANVPSRIALSVASQIDSRVILDASGAEKLLGKGDMLFKGGSMGAPRRVQCCWISDGDVEKVVEYVKKHCGTAVYDESANDAMENYSSDGKGESRGGDDGDDELDPMFWDCVRFAIESGKASTSLLQRKFSLGYGRAAKIIDKMEEKGIIGEYTSKGRDVIMTMGEYNEMMVNRE